MTGALPPLFELLGFCTSRAEASIERWSRALAIREATLGAHEPRTVNVRFVLALFHNRLGNQAEVLSLLLPVLVAYEGGLLREDSRLQQSLSLLGICARQSNQSNVAERAYRGCVEQARAQGQTGPHLLIPLCNLGLLLVIQGRTDEARPLLDEALALARNTPDTEAGTLLTSSRP